MKKLLTILSLFICSIVIGQYKSLDKNDTTNYTQVDNLVELKEFGYNYVGKHIILNCRFWYIDNGILSNTPESNKGSSMEGGMSYYDPKKVRELVGFSITKLKSENSSSFESFENLYGYQKDILDNIKKYKEGDDIVVLGKVVKWTNGEHVGIRVKYVYTLDEYNNSVTTQTEETTTDVTYKPKEKSFFDIILEKIVIIVIIIIVMGVFVYIKNRNKKED
jgi:hypothetical protein